jgi:hypothetical protein
MAVHLMQVNGKNYTANYGFEVLFDSILLSHRKRVFKKVFGVNGLDHINTILDIGSTSDSGSASNLFLTFFKERYVVSISDQEMPLEVRSKFPHVIFLQGDALNLNFPNSKFDLVFSNATLEHVGNKFNQKKFISESIRVGSKETIIIIPNRWFPIETHTKLPFLHYLPNKFHRKIIKFLGFTDLSLEENLNIPTKREVSRLIKELGIEKYNIYKIKTLLFTSNLVIHFKL